MFVCPNSIPFYMSSDCENLLRKFLVLNPAKRATLETIMRDKWMNMGYEEDELKPFIENAADLKDPKRIGKTGTVHDNLITMNVCCSSRYTFSDAHSGWTIFKCISHIALYVSISIIS